MARRITLFLLALGILSAMGIAATGGGPAIAVPSDGSAPGDRGAGALTTLFASNGGYAGNMFDMEPFVDLHEIQALDVNHGGAGDAIEIQVFYKEGTCVGFEEDPAAWTLLGIGTAVSAGMDQPTHVDLSGNGVSFSYGQIYGLYVHLESYPLNSGILRYTNSNGPMTYANDDLKVTTYCGKGYPAFGATFFYRIWNGTIYYDAGDPPPLRIYPEEISAWYGGRADFYLNGGPDQAGRKYVILSSLTGSAPGTPLPGGFLLPINWDLFTEIMLDLAVSGNPMIEGFIGKLDANGHAEASITLPGHTPLAGDISAYFAWCTYGPFSFVSNSATLVIHGMP